MFEEIVIASDPFQALPPDPKLEGCKGRFGWFALVSPSSGWVAFAGIHRLS
jgi:hypothetical protein